MVDFAAKISKFRNTHIIHAPFFLVFCLTRLFFVRNSLRFKKKDATLSRK